MPEAEMPPLQASPSQCAENDPTLPALNKACALSPSSKIELSKFLVAQGLPGLCKRYVSKKPE